MLWCGLVEHVRSAKPGKDAHYEKVVSWERSARASGVPMARLTQQTERRQEMATIRVGNAPCSWGALEFDDLDGEGIGYARMLDELAATGYTGTELGDWGFMPTEPEALRAELAARNLTMLGAFVPVAFREASAHEAGETQTLRIARLLAGVADADHAPFVVLADDNGTVHERTHHAGRVTENLALTDEEWRTFAAGVERIAQVVHDATGLPCVFHHHCAGYVETPDEIARLLDRTDPGLVGLVFDTGHYAFGSGAPAAESVQAGLERFGDRVWYVHFKDCAADIAAQARAEEWDYFAAVGHGVFCELGRGCVDFPGVLQWLRDRDYDGWICVEQDILPGMGAPKESAQRNRDYLRELGL